MNAAEFNAYSAVATILKRCNVAVSKDRLARLCFEHPSFPTLLSVSDLLKKFGFRVSVRRLDFSSLDSWTTFPTLVFVKDNGGKLMILESLDNSYVYLTDTAGGRVRMGREYFADIWDGLIFDLQKHLPDRGEDGLFSRGMVRWITASCVCFSLIAYFGFPVYRLSNLHSLIVGLESLIAITGCYVSARLLGYLGLSNVYKSLNIVPDKEDLQTIGKRKTSLSLFSQTVILAFFLLCLIVNLYTGTSELGSRAYLFSLFALVVCGAMTYLGPYPDRYLCWQVRIICFLAFAIALLEIVAFTFFAPMVERTFDTRAVVMFLTLIMVFLSVVHTPQPAHHTFRAIARMIVNFKFDPARLRAIKQQERTMAPLFEDMHVYSLGRVNVDVITVVADPRYHQMNLLIHELILISETFSDVEIQLVFSYVAPFPEYLKALDLFEKFPEKDFTVSANGLSLENFRENSANKWTDQQRLLIRNHLNWSALSGVRSGLQIFYNDRALPDYCQVGDLLYLIRGLKTVR